VPSEHLERTSRDYLSLRENVYPVLADGESPTFLTAPIQAMEGVSPAGLRVEIAKLAGQHRAIRPVPQGNEGDPPRNAHSRVRELNLPIDEPGSKSGILYGTPGHPGPSPLYRSRKTSAPAPWR